ncbi:tripartite ATP-independent transporter DctM subunit [Hoeflea marina]|uniref:TRAP transporter large permease protein n=1 Tax=Hoeflea marina TaxID=274592 RepID=A0A317PKM4_9HYPH|nr:TRAP transporter large permease [Hoeflea marina]PWW00328.1 tripartite ATP-independent transporter DctM subunit [Hoeflea marina]
MSFAFAACLLVVLVLAGIGTPIAFSMILGTIMYVLVKGQDLALPAEQMIQGLYDSFILLAVPLFIVAANIMNAGTISDRLLNFCVALVGRFRGGLGHVNVVASLIFAGMSGSAVADAAGIGKIIIEMMRKDGRYPAGYAAAITAASSTIGPIIPPSIPMVMYALISGTSIGYLFLGGIVPGLFMGAVLMALNYWISIRRGFKVEEPVPLRELPVITTRAFPALLMPAILLYGIYGGVTTPTEGAAVAAAYALILAAVFYRALSLKGLYSIMVQSAHSSAAVGLVIGGALIFNYVVASENIPAKVEGFISTLDVSPIVFLLVVNLLFLALGCLLDASTIILVIVPLFIPAARHLGIDLIHFGVVTVVNCMIGLITPPYGIVLFVINAVTGIPLREIVREIWLFIGVLIAALLAMILFPGIILWLPRLLGYQG